MVLVSEKVESKVLSRPLVYIFLEVRLRKDMALSFFLSSLFSSLMMGVFCSALMVPICSPKDLITSGY